jgi:hypothetical protein
MSPTDQSRFDELYQQHLIALKLAGKARKTIDAYGRAVRHLATFLDRCLMACDGSHVTFRYRDARTRRHAHRTLPIADFLWHLLQHVLPNRFRRPRDFGFLHGNAKPLLRLLQLMLHVRVPEPVLRAVTTFVCRACGANMHTVFTTPAPPRPG